jgi:S1-C subfamily serine protease
MTDDERKLSDPFGREATEASRPGNDESPPPRQPDVPTPPPVYFSPRVHPLNRPTVEPGMESQAAQAARIRLAWAKLVWLLAFLALLLAISYLVPYIAEQTQYAITRGRQRAEHDFAQEHLGASPIAEVSRAYQQVSQVVGPCVVHINTQAGEPNILPLSTMRTRATRIPSEGQGSGIIMDAGGFILTNNHVVKGASGIQVSLSDGRKATARVIGRDGKTDLAVLKIDADKLTPAEWGDSEAIEPGALVWAVGSPFGLERTITSGILSAKHRSGLAGNSQQDFLQTDAAVNPGNSGGPLVDASGKVIGVNTAIVGESYQGISFAIPSNVAREIYDRIKTEGTIRRGWLGVQLDEMTPEHVQQTGLPGTTGVYILGMFQQGEGSPAARAGIMPGDVLLRWNNTPVNSPADLRSLVEKTPVNSKAKVAVFRQGQEVNLEVVVGERPQQLD